MELRAESLVKTRPLRVVRASCALAAPDWVAGPAHGWGDVRTTLNCGRARGQRQTVIARLPNSCFQFGRAMNALPAKLGFVASEMPAGRGLQIDRAAEIQIVDDAAGRQGE